MPLHPDIEAFFTRLESEGKSVSQLLIPSDLSPLSELSGILQSKLPWVKGVNLYPNLYNLMELYNRLVPVDLRTNPHESLQNVLRTFLEMALVSPRKEPTIIQVTVFPDNPPNDYDIGDVRDNEDDEWVPPAVGFNEGLYSMFFRVKEPSDLTLDFVIKSYQEGFSKFRGPVLNKILTPLKELTPERWQHELIGIWTVPSGGWSSPSHTVLLRNIALTDVEKSNRTPVPTKVPTRFERLANED